MSGARWSWAWGLGLLTAAVAACGPPAGALVTQCTNEPLGLRDPWACAVSSERMDVERTAAFHLNPYWPRVDVTADLATTAGTAVVTIDQLPGRSWTLGPSAPLHLALTVPFDRGLKGFMLRVQPAAGPLERLTGTVHYQGRESR